MGALLNRYADVGVTFRSADDGGLEAIGPLTDALRAEIRAHKTRLLAELGADDGRRRCVQCRNLSDSGQCLGALRGVPLGFAAPRIYHPVAELLQHCAGYLPFPEDPDQRPGLERWPSLLMPRPAKQGVH